MTAEERAAGLVEWREAKADEYWVFVSGLRVASFYLKASAEEMTMRLRAETAAALAQCERDATRRALQRAAEVCQRLADISKDSKTAVPSDWRGAGECAVMLRELAAEEE